MCWRKAAMALTFGLLVPPTALFLLAYALRAEWAHLAVDNWYWWWPGTVYGLAALAMAARAHGPIWFFLGTYFLGSIATSLIGTLIWSLFWPTWPYAPFIIFATAALPALPGVLLCSLVGARLIALPSIREEVRWFWNG